MQQSTNPTSLHRQDGTYGWRTSHQTQMQRTEYTSNANAIWNIIEVGDDENDVGMTTDNETADLPSASRMIQSSVMKPRGVAMIKKGNQLFPAKFSGPIPHPSGLRRNSSNSKFSYSSTNHKYSHRMRNLLQSDLKMGGDCTATRIPPRTTLKQPRPVGLTTSLSATSSHRRKIRKTGSLQDAFSQDIQSLLKSLHSDEFVGTIHPQYHARYISDESLKP